LIKPILMMSWHSFSKGKMIINRKFRLHSTNEGVNNPTSDLSLLEIGNCICTS